jgi:hypothetical protein
MKADDSLFGSFLSGVVNLDYCDHQVIGLPNSVYGIPFRDARLDATSAAELSSLIV